MFTWGPVFKDVCICKLFRLQIVEDFPPFSSFFLGSDIKNSSVTRPLESDKERIINILFAVILNGVE